MHELLRVELALRYNDAENNVALWGFHNGIRRPVKFSDRARKFMLDRAGWHELKMSLDSADFKAWLDGDLALEYVLGSEPGPDATTRLQTPISFPRTTRSCARPSPAGSDSGRKPTARVTSKITWSLRK